MRGKSISIGICLKCFYDCIASATNFTIYVCFYSQLVAHWTLRTINLNVALAKHFACLLLNLHRVCYCSFKCSFLSLVFVLQKKQHRSNLQCIRWSVFFRSLNAIPKSENNLDNNLLLPFDTTPRECAIHVTWALHKYFRHFYMSNKIRLYVHFLAFFDFYSAAHWNLNSVRRSIRFSCRALIIRQCGFFPSIAIRTYSGYVIDKYASIWIFAFLLLFSRDYFTVGNFQYNFSFFPRQEVVLIVTLLLLSSDCDYVRLLTFIARQKGKRRERKKTRRTKIYLPSFDFCMVHVHWHAALNGIKINWDRCFICLSVFLLPCSSHEIIIHLHWHL